MSVHLCRCWMSGNACMVLTIDPALKKEMGLLPRDVVGFRVVNVGGKRLLVGEKIPLNKIAVLSKIPEGIVKNGG
jgi:hypothetical protein